jgi:hypothetical protein
LLVSLRLFLFCCRFIKGLPRDRDLDGELFGGRGNFQSTISIVKAGVEEWKNMRYEVLFSREYFLKL